MTLESLLANQARGGGQPKRPPVDSAESSRGMTSGFRGGPRVAPVATNGSIVHITLAQGDRVSWPKRNQVVSDASWPR